MTYYTNPTVVYVEEPTGAQVVAEVIVTGVIIYGVVKLVQHLLDDGDDTTSDIFSGVTEEW